MPKQFPSQEEAELISNAASNVETSMLASVAVPFALQFAFKSILSKSWPLINSLQLASMHVIMTTKMPVNVQEFDKSYQGVINFSIIPTDLVKNWLLSLYDSNRADKPEKRIL